MTKTEKVPSHGHLDSGECELENKPINKHTNSFDLLICAIKKIPQGGIVE